MHAVANTTQLVADGVLVQSQAQEIEARSRAAMIFLAINLLLCGGIAAATGGLIFWLADPFAVAVGGTFALAVGLAIIGKASSTFRMFGNAAAIIGAGMLIGGGTAELLTNYRDIAGSVMLGLGIPIALIGFAALRSKFLNAGFVFGSILLMGTAVHLGGLAEMLQQTDATGLGVSVSYLYAAALIVAAGWATDVRFITALAIFPLAQVLDTGTLYRHAAYVFYSPEATLTIIQMAILIAICVWVGSRMGERTTRHAMILAIMAFIVANLSALVGTLWGDYVGETLWGTGRYRSMDLSYDDWQSARSVFRETALYISEQVYLVCTFAILGVITFWAAHKNLRGLFNTALTFAGIHAYTQLFENYFREPIAYVLGGLIAIPAAWGLWRLNIWLQGRATKK